MKLLKQIYETKAGKTALLNTLAITKVPLLAVCTPVIVESTEQRCEIKIPGSYRTHNHVGSMYFGAMAMGAELSIALPVVEQGSIYNRPITFLFKDFQANFSKKAIGDVHFICEDVPKVLALIEKTIEEKGKSEGTFSGFACVPSLSADPIMSYKLTIALKCTNS